jgi:hypothetical protein
MVGQLKTLRGCLELIEASDVLVVLRRTNFRSPPRAMTLMQKPVINPSRRGQL